jgi:hypothetical protein
MAEEAAHFMAASKQSEKGRAHHFAISFEAMLPVT